jgi:hypothetical protein
MRTALVTDSTADLPKPLRERLGVANCCPFCHHPYQQMKLSHWARRHGMGYLTAWRWLRGDILSSARKQLYERHSARNRAKRALEVMGCG